MNYGKLLSAIGNAEVVMIGEASHGTHEFYQQRCEITKLLIQEKGFNIIATEADWPDAYRVNRFVQHGKVCKDKTAEDSLGDFKRFPLWMWRNREVVEFVDWLRKWNDDHPNSKCAYYGMDLYSFFTSMDKVVEYLNQVSQEDAKRVQKSYSVFERFQGEPSAYGFATGVGLAPSFENEVVKTLVDLQKKGEEYLKGAGGLIDGDELFYTTQNAKLVADAEEYYRKMYHADARTWNIRDNHMASTVQSIMEFHANKLPNRMPKAVIWAHNSHLGDARQTDSKKLRGEWNVGQLLRQRLGMDRTFNVGFSTYSGTVAASDEWDDPAKCKKVRPGMPDSWEDVFHDATRGADVRDYELFFRSNDPNTKVDNELLERLGGRRYERYIG